MKEKTKFGIIGALGGITNGFFGSGGGLFLVPLFIGWGKLSQKKAFASSVAVILPLSLISAAVYMLNGGIDIKEALPYMAGGAVGGVISGLVFRKVSAVFLRRAFGALIIYGGIRAVLGL